MVSTTLVINEFAVAGASAADEYVEIKNISGQEIDLTGYRIVYRSSAGTTDVAVFAFPAGTKIAAGGYLLITNSSGYAGAVAGDFTWTTGSTGTFAAAAGGLAIRNGALNTGTIVDSVAYGTATNAFREGGANAPAPSSAQAALRSQDTDSNSTDFAVGARAPQNSSTTPGPIGQTQTVQFNPVSVTHDEGNSGSTAYVFTVTRTGGTTGQLDFSGTIAAGTTNGADYVGGTAPTTFSGSIAAGQTSATVTVNVQGDFTVESAEAFTLTLTNATNADGTVTVSIGANSGATGNITNDDGPGTINIDDVVIAEGDSGTTSGSFALHRVGGATGTVSVDYTITLPGGAGGADGTDVTGPLTGTVTFLEGQTGASVPFTINGDVTNEPNETFTVALANATGGASIGDGSATATITNDDAPPTLSIGDATLVEGNGGITYLVFTVSLSKVSLDPVTVDFATANGTGTAGSDYLALSGQVGFAAGELTKTVSVAVVGDTAIEANETLTVGLSNPVNATILDGSGLGTITNDDTLAYHLLAAGPLSENWTDTSRIAANDDWSKIASIRGYLGNTDPDGAATGVDPRTITGANPGDVDVIANLTATTSTSGGVGEFHLADPTIGLQGSGTADAPSIVLFLDASGRTDIRLTANLRDIDTTADNAAQQVAVQYRTDPNGAWTNAPGGYFADVTTGGTATQVTALDVTLPADANYSPTLQIRILTTNAAGNDEWVGVDDIVVTSAQGSLPSYGIADAAAYEGTGASPTPISFTVTRVGDSSAAGTVDYSVTFAGGGFSAGASDLSSPLAGTVSFAPGETSKILTLDIVADSTPEADEAFTVALSNPSSGNVTHPAATGTIVNDDGAPPYVTVSDVSKDEGNSGTTSFAFTVTRTGGTGAFSVDYATLDGTASAGDDYVAAAGTLNFLAGENSKTVTVTVNGDTIPELRETFSLQLSNPTGFAVLADPAGTATILNDDLTAIYVIQGSGNSSPLVGQEVRTRGIVTAVDSNGYYIQDAAGDGNSATSDAVFVFTGATAPTVTVGELVEVTGTVTEFVAGTNALSVTEISSVTTTTHISTGNPLPAAIVIGAGGVVPPTANGPGDGFGNALAFYESMEGMLVTVKAPLVVSDTNSFGETWVLASGGAAATGVNARGGITLSSGDYNPERIQIDNDANLSPTYTPTHTTGDVLADVTGIMNYANTSYEVLVIGTVSTTTDITLPKETTSLAKDAGHLTVASYNVENLDVGDGQAKFDLLAGNIVYNLAAPDIIGLQEVQDADGPGNGSDLSGVVTAQKLIDAIKAIGGPNYVYIEIAPTTAGSTGGEPGGNIRNGYLYNPDRVTYVAGSAHLIDVSAFNGSRKPLVADFIFNNQTIELINVHLTSRLGSEDLEGAHQPATNAGDATRTAMAQAVRSYVNDTLATNPALKLGVLGDFNGFYFEGAVGALEAGGVMTDLHRLLAPEERYSYQYEGNSQAIDHLIVTQNLAGVAEFDAVHLNSEFGSNTNRPTDHDPIVGRFAIAVPNVAPALDLNGGDPGVDNSASYSEQDAPTLLSTMLTVSDSDDANIESATVSIGAGFLAGYDYLTVNGATNGVVNGVTIAYNAQSGVLTLTGSASLAVYQSLLRQVGFESTSDAPGSSRSIGWTISDGEATSAAATTTLTVTDVNDAPSGTDKTITAIEDTFRVLSASDFGFTDPDGTFASVTISAVSGGSIYYDADGSAGAGTPVAVTLPRTYSAQDLADGKVSFRAAENANGAALGTISFAVTDDDGATDATPNTLTVDVTAVNDAPVAKPDEISTLENAIKMGSLFADNGSGPDADVEGDTISISAVNGSAANVGVEITLNSGAKLTVNSDGSYTYDPNGKFNDLTDSSSGATNTYDQESFEYTVAGGNTVTVIVTVNGVAGPGDRLEGDANDNDIGGTSGTDVFMLQDGGSDTAHGSGGNDGFYMGGSLDSTDYLDGGEGRNDQLILHGDYSTQLTLGVNNLLDTEVLSLVSGSNDQFADYGTALFSYNLKSVDENVAAGRRLVIDFTNLLAGENVTFDGSAETDGAFTFGAGKGIDTLIGGAGADLFLFRDGGRYGANDTVDGGGGNDELALRGNYSGANAITFQANTMTNVEVLSILSGNSTWWGPVAGDFSYDLTSHDNNVLAGEKLIVDAAQLTVNEVLKFNGAAETDGYFWIAGGAASDTLTGGAGDDLLIGGLGADTLSGGGGADTFRYRSSADSTTISADRILGFTSGTDKIDLAGIDADTLSDGDQAFHWVGANAFSGFGAASAGELRAYENNGTWFVEGDTNGDGVADLLITLESPTPLAQGDFLL
ncbi:MAG TPA: Calx-beta domain-containing protein [Allosphingosinicella sp.]|nr:Calx-beta domain-containing protein [Allosphingosinicella sp.]